MSLVPDHWPEVYPVGAVKPVVVVILSVPEVADTMTFTGSSPLTVIVVPDALIKLYIVVSGTLYVEEGVATD